MRNRSLKTLTTPALVLAAALVVPSAQPAEDPAGGRAGGVSADTTSARGPGAAMAVPIGPIENWTTVAASGLVESRRPGAQAESWARVRRGNQVVPLSRLRTDRRGRATMARKGDIILVSPGSELTLPADGDTDQKASQSSGKALYKIEPGRKGSFEVVTPYLVAGVKGTLFSVVVEDRFVAVQVVSGHVEVRSLLRPGESTDLFAGHMLTMDGSDGRMEIYREGLHPEGRPEEPVAPEARRVRKQTRRMVHSLSREKNRLDLARLWKERLRDERRLEMKELDDTRLQLYEERQDTKLEDDSQKRLCASGQKNDC